MMRSLRVRFAVMLGICGLVGLGLAVSAGGTDRWRSRVTVVRTSSGIVRGAFRGSSPSGIVLGVDGRVRVVPWSAVTGISFGEGPSTGVPLAPRDAAFEAPAAATVPTAAAGADGPIARGTVAPRAEDADGPAS